MTFAKIHEVKEGTRLITDGGFTCMKEGEVKTVFADEDGDLCVECDEGSHLIDPQLDSIHGRGPEYIGLSLAPEQG